MSTILKVDFKRPAIISLLLINAIILALALILDWSLYDIIFSYWLENLVIGFYNIFKMYKVDGGNPEDHYKIENDKKVYVPPIKTPFVIIFICHFGILWAIYGNFIQKEFNMDELLYQTDNGYDFVKLIDWPMRIAFIGLFISHGVDYFKNFIGKKEYVNRTFSKQMVEPYKGILIINSVLLSVAMFSWKTTGSHPFMLFFMILLKVLVELKLFEQDHKLNKMKNKI